VGIETPLRRRQNRRHFPQYETLKKPRIVNLRQSSPDKLTTLALLGLREVILETQTILLMGVHIGLPFEERFHNALAKIGGTPTTTIKLFLMPVTPEPS